MAQKLDYPKTEEDFRRLQDEIYQLTLKALENNELPRFKGLLEIISSETVILTAIHNIKNNKGSQTPGADGKTMRENILQINYAEVISLVQGNLKDYKPTPVRRVYIPKPGKTEKRPLGIPAIIDRIIQECIKIVIEPILEAQFYKHSYGFRPMRDAHMALERINNLSHTTGYHWVVEGDISKFFDNVNHTTLIKKLWHYGIRDRRVLMIIKAMLKAGIMDELKENPLGTPQGGIISPLLANAYLNTFDKWVAREWEEKKTRTNYSRQDGKIKMLKSSSNLKPAYLIRYADDWVIITSTKSNAEKWKRRIKHYLQTKLKLTLSEEKTIITNIRQKPIHFLGFNFKLVRGNSKTGYVTRTKPNPDRLRAKVKEISLKIRKLKKIRPTTKKDKERLVNGINLINSIIRGAIQYYQAATWVNIEAQKYADRLAYTAYKALKPHGGKWTPANQLSNLVSVHSNYATQVPAIKFGDSTVGITRLSFCKWQKSYTKNQNETPYTPTGRLLYFNRSRKKPLIVRADELLSTPTSQKTLAYNTNSIYNFEFYLNRPYVFNRDKGKCRVCDINLWTDNVRFHHISPYLAIDKVNRATNFTCTCNSCHKKIHNTIDYSFLVNKTWKKILKFREKLDKLT